MNAYSVPIPIRMCAACLEKASMEVFNRFNATCGFFCSHHAQVKVKELDEADRLWSRLETIKVGEKP